MKVIRPVLTVFLVCDDELLEHPHESLDLSVHLSLSCCNAVVSESEFIGKP